MHVRRTVKCHSCRTPCYAATAQNVRTEYFTLARDFRALAAQFDLAVDAALERDLIRLMAAFEAIDRHVDALGEREARARLAARIVAAIERDDATLDGELRARLGELRAILPPGGARFVAGSLARFFAHSEELRTTTDPTRYLRAVLDEAARASEMTLLIAARLADARFSRFFGVLSEVANLLDKLHDVRGDHRRGEIAIAADVRLHARLAAAFAARAARLLLLAPRPLKLLAWAARYFVPPTRGPADRATGYRSIARAYSCGNGTAGIGLPRNGASFSQPSPSQMRMRRRSSGRSAK